MATLADLRNYVRRQTETTSAELPNTTIDPYLREAFNRTYNAENRWPFYETEWTLTQTAGNNYLTMPSDLNRNAIISLVDNQDSDYPLVQIAYEIAVDRFYQETAVLAGPTHFSLWGTKMHLWPRATWADDRTYTLLGYRKPTDWVAVGDASEPDIDDELHYPLAHYAIALAYAQQEDETLETQYMIRWERDVELARRRIMEPSVNAPVRMGGGRWRAYNRGNTWKLT